MPSLLLLAHFLLAHHRPHKPTHIHGVNMSSSTRLTHSIGGSAIRADVLDASIAEISETQDLGGIVWMEHINLVVGSRLTAEKFYLDYLGFTKDASKSFHVNLGQQQFHLAETGDPAQVISGSIGLTVPSLDTIRKRTPHAIEAFRGTHFRVLEDADCCLTIVCPFGNRLHLYGVNDDPVECVVKSGQKMVMSHADGGPCGPRRMAVRGQPGIRYVEIACRPNVVSGIAEFYKDVMGCTVTKKYDTGRAIVSVGPGVHLVFVENSDLSDESMERMQGVHLCIYVNDFAGLYSRLNEKGLIWTNPRFTYLDRCDTWEEASASRTLRFKTIVDTSTRETVLELEHETRSLRHGQFLKVPRYEPR